MEEDTAILINYLRIIWKQKILIIVGALVCMAAAGVVSIWTVRPPAPVPELPLEIYHAEAMVRIGRKLGPFPTRSYPRIDDTQNLIEVIPVENDLNVGVKMATPDIIMVSLEGIDKGKVKGLLEGVVNRVLADHLIKQENSAQPYRDAIEKMEAESKKLQEYISKQDAKLTEIYTEENDIVATALVVIAQNETFQLKGKLVRAHDAILLQRTTVSALKNCSTKMIGGVEITKTPPPPPPPPLPQNGRSKLAVIIMGGLVGMTLSIFLAFLMESLNDARRKEKGDMNDSR